MTWGNLLQHAQYAQLATVGKSGPQFWSCPYCDSCIAQNLQSQYLTFEGQAFVYLHIVTDMNAYHVRRNNNHTVCGEIHLRRAVSCAVESKLKQFRNLFCNMDGWPSHDPPLGPVLTDLVRLCVCAFVRRTSK